ncbi:hypothetical protein XM38_050740 [Halomicronema hongdechloris C2206]|uniref:PD-(D/E)XK endonuclease-like domain-containing protein n=1 Tax=Halomicronema hongdechloris C2206 TaxID=1641165 RepID=A0A1Z3HUY0_9CYAN|nr:PD-(D/E)XK nuclease family protein [Halomicronema hongdechloris]ASC74099.1 hypothetical protein XM38_050740 [Halomicronema hongdechloris C2206]
MMTDPDALLPLSQGHLTLLEVCPRKFQHVYLDGLSGPIDPDQLYGQRWGSQFHRLMQQQILGLPLTPLPADGADLLGCLSALLEAAPDLFQKGGTPFRQSEHRRTLACNGYLLTGIYDLLILTANTGHILDWKTHLSPRSSAALQQDWQTRLYLYLLVETTELLPEQVAMTYWFVRCRDPQTGDWTPQRVRLGYSLERHEQTRRDLLRLTNQLSQLRYQSRPFPQVDISQGICDRCPFVIRCQRHNHSEPGTSDGWPAPATIAEVPI